MLIKYRVGVSQSVDMRRIRSCRLTVTDEEMRTIMKSAVDRAYALLHLRSGDPDGYARQIAFGARYVAKSDEPHEPGAQSKWQRPRIYHSIYSIRVVSAVGHEESVG